MQPASPSIQRAVATRVQGPVLQGRVLDAFGLPTVIRTWSPTALQIPKNGKLYAANLYLFAQRAM